MRKRVILGTVPLLLCLGAHNVMAQAALTEEQRKQKTELYGGAMALQFGIDVCDIETTLKQRNDVKNKIAELKQQANITGELSTADIKDALELKTDADIKQYCIGMKMTLPGMIAAMLADKPPGEWSKSTDTADKTAPAAADATPAAAGSNKVAGDWEVEPVSDSLGQCTVARDYFDNGDETAETAVLVRNAPGKLVMALTYMKWNYKPGEAVEAPLVTSESIIDRNAKWTGDKTGKVITYTLSSDKLPALKKAKDLIVRFSDGDATFAIPRFDEALDALTACSTKK